MYFRVLGRTTATAASTVTFIVPAFAILWGAIALGEPVGPDLVLGFALVIVSLVLVLGVPIGGLVRLHRPRAAVAASAVGARRRTGRSDAYGSERIMPPSTATIDARDVRRRGRQQERADPPDLRHVAVAAERDVRLRAPARSPRASRPAASARRPSR